MSRDRKKAGHYCWIEMATDTDINEVLARLADAPRHFAQVTRDLAPSRLRYAPNSDTWSIQTILAHLRACADVWGKSIYAMIAEDRPTLRYVSPRTWMKRAHYAELEFHVSLAAYTRQREELLVALAALNIEEWSRGASFTGTVRGRDQTVFSCAQRIADHELQHFEQVAAILRDPS